MKIGQVILNFPCNIMYKIKYLEKLEKASKGQLVIHLYYSTEHVLMKIFCLYLLILNVHVCYIKCITTIET